MMTGATRLSFGLWLCAALLMGVPAEGLAQSNWPNRPFRLLVGNSAGAGPDIVARLLADHMSRRVGQPWVVENRPGADGMIAAEATARSAPDGYTLMLSSQSPVAVEMHIKKALPIDATTAFSHIAVIVDETAGMAVGVHPSLPVKSLPELVAYAKANPGKLSFSTTVAYGTMFGAWLKKRTGIEMVEVRYKVASQAVQDAIAGRVQVAFQSPGALGAQVKAAKLRFLSFATAKRIDDWPDVPTVAETFPEFSMRGFMVLIGPAGMAADAVQKLNREAAAVVKDPKFTQELGKIYWFNFEGARTPQGTSEFIRRERETWGKLIREIGIEPQ
jgi:tripartite-type tricarboxylate transporter receptor subunit TctC